MMSQQLLHPPCLGTITDLYADKCLSCFSYSQCQAERRRLQLFAASVPLDRFAYREANKDKLAAQQRAYREANKDKLAAQQRAYYEANKDKRAAQQRAYYEANKDKLAAQQRAYYEANKDKRAAQQRAYREARKKHHLLEAAP